MQKLVNETFQKLWFTPTPSHDQEAMNRKILNITDVVCIYAFVCLFVHIIISPHFAELRGATVSTACLLRNMTSLLCFLAGAGV